MTDDGTPSLDDSETITVTVNEVNVAPELGAIGDQSVDEEVELTFTATATDADDPANTLTFSLDAGAPAGASIDATTGAFSWTPTETQGPGSYDITVRVTDDGSPSLDDSETITVTVNEVNVAPVLGAIGDQSVDEEVELTFTATATDADDPANTLTFSLDAGAPAGASINATTGAFSWTPTDAQGPGSYDITIRVTDDGTPSLDDSETITVTVNALKAYWMFNEGSGSTASDSFGNSDGTIFGGVTWTDGVTAAMSDSALDLDGSSGYVQVANTEALNVTGTSITMMAWIYPRSGGDSGGSRIISKMNNAGDGDVYSMFTDSYRLRFRLDNADMISSHIIELNEWVHVAMVYDGTDKRIYINGALDAATPQPKTDAVDGSVNPVQLGRRESGGPRFYDGILDEVRIYRQALSDTDIADIFTSVTPVDPSPGGLSFTDITVSAGTAGPADGGHGVMFAEVDDDSLPDYYLTNNLEFNANRPDYYFDNIDGANFAETAAALGIEDTDGGSHGAVWADLDNDGDYDLVNGTTWLNSNPGRGNPDEDDVFENRLNEVTADFVEVTPAVFQPPNTIIETRGITALDMDADGDLDLFGVTGSQIPETNVAYLNDGSFGFSVPANDGDLRTAVAMQGVIDTDYDGDGDIDLLAGNRGGEFALLENDGTNDFSLLGTGVFTQISPATLGLTDSAGDGITTADVDNDGDLDMLLMSDGIAHLYLRDDTAVVLSDTYSKSQSFISTEGYMGGFADLDNDGDLDLVFAGDERVFINNGSGTFASGQSVPVSGIADPRAIAFADIDGDGDLDFAIAAKDSRNWLVLNDLDPPMTPDNVTNWLKVELVSPQCQAGAFGAKVRVRPAGDAVSLVGMREAKGNHGYLGQDDPVLHFGLGSEASVDVFVDFVDGTSTSQLGVGANQRILIDECP